MSGKRLVVRCPESVQTPGKQWWEWPACGWFIANAWEARYDTQDGTSWAWGGTCKRHGEVRDAS